MRLFAGRLLPQDVAQRLVRALEDGERIGADGVPEVPGRYSILLNPEDLEALRHHHPNLDDELNTALKALTARMNVRLRETPSIIIQADAELPLRDVRITLADRVPPMEERTGEMSIARLQEMLAHKDRPETRAYLIVESERTFNLTESTVRIGRALDNDLILEDRRISRHHAQLRQRYGRYILQDLGSRGGTKVNGFPVQEIVLRPGDMITLSGVSLIYAEEEPGRRESDGGTQPLQHTEG